MGYVDAAIDDELAILRSAQPGGQDDAVNKGAFALAGMLNWPGVVPASVKARFTDAVLGLPSRASPGRVRTQRANGLAPCVMPRHVRSPRPATPLMAMPADGS